MDTKLYHVVLAQRQSRVTKPRLVVSFVLIVGILISFPPPHHHLDGGEEKSSAIRANQQLAFKLATKRSLARLETWVKEDKQHAPVRLASNLKDLLYLQANGKIDVADTQLLNLIRIPKAGSSALSITARALAGCQPDGLPCCANYPRKACPAPNLDCSDLIRGCLGHRPKYGIKYKVGHNKGQDLPVITSLRHPVGRALSAFFYSPPHRPQRIPPNRMNVSWSFFSEHFISIPTWKNPATKMLLGQYAYADIDYPINSTNVVNKATSRLCSMSWFGIAEWPIMSALMLYESHPFSLLQPNPVAFGLPPITSTNNNNTAILQADQKKADSVRKNQKKMYKQFKEGVFVEHNGTDLVLRHHSHDWEVYQFALRLFCARVLDTDLIAFIMQDEEAPDLMKHFEPCLRFYKLPSLSLGDKGETEAERVCKRVGEVR